MKYALICFAAGILCYVTADIISDVLPVRKLARLGEDHPAYRETMEWINNPIDVRGEEWTEKTYTLESLRELDIPSYMKVIHDGRLGKEVVVKGPPSLLDRLTMKTTNDKLRTEIDRRFRIDRPLTVSLNLHEHANRALSVYPNLREGQDEAVYTGFETATPLEMELLRVDDLTVPISVAVENLVIGKNVPSGMINGTATRAEIMTSQADSIPREFPDLKRGEWIVTADD